jgi:hypothetical protein
MRQRLGLVDHRNAAAGCRHPAMKRTHASSPSSGI